jgi:tetratricopeptide (TPR) repeat protein
VRIKAVLANAQHRTYAYDEAIRLLKECIVACENGVVKDTSFQFRRLVELAMALTNSRDSKQALATYERALELAESFADRPSMAALYAGMAKTYQNEGDLEAAITYNAKSLQMYEELGLMHQVACTLDNAALLYAEYGNRERARECLARATVLAKETKRMGTLASIQTSEAEVTAKTDPEAGLLGAQEALRFAKKIDQPDAQIRALTLIGELKMTTSPAVAKRSFQEASQLAEERAPQLLRVIFDRWSRAAEARGDSDEALRLARRALETVRT